MKRKKIFKVLVKTATLVVRLKHRSMRFELQRAVSKEIHLKQWEEAEDNLTMALAPVIEEQVKSISQKLGGLGEGAADTSKRTPEEVAEYLIGKVFNPDDWEDEILDAAIPVMAVAMGEAMSALMISLGFDPRVERKATSASRYLAENPDDFEGLLDSRLLAREVPDVNFGVLTEYPSWMKRSIGQHLRYTFKQDYWKNISETTGGNAEVFLKEGIKNGWSIQKIASRMKTTFKDDTGKYALRRARNIARTEVGHALNGARKKAITKLSEDLGDEVPMKASWLSVLGNTTRDTHAILDGVPEDENGNWNLGGVETPWPAHPVLPPEDRCNCQCTIINEFGMQEDEARRLIEEHEERVASLAAGEPEPEKPKPEEPKPEEQQELTTMEDILEKDNELIGLLEAANAAAEDMSAELKEVDKKRQSLLDENKRHTDRKNVLRDRNRDSDGDLKPHLEWNPADWKEHLEIQTQVHKNWDELNDLNYEKIRIRKGVSTKIWSAIEIEDPDLRAEFEWQKRPDYAPIPRVTGRRVLQSYGREFEEKMEEADRFLGTLTGKSGIPLGTGPYPLDNKPKGKIKLYAHRLRAGDRACHVTTPGGYGTPNQEGLFITKAHEQKVFVHELAHSVERRTKQGWEVARKFRDYRIAKAGTTNVRMRDLYPNSGYPADEIGNRDDWDKAFGDSHPEYVGRQYPSGHHATEVVSMGCELLYEDPYKLLEEDPEMFKFIVGFLRGKFTEVPL
jgi:hypothetical protein